MHANDNLLIQKILAHFLGISGIHNTSHISKFTRMFMRGVKISEAGITGKY